MVHQGSIRVLSVQPIDKKKLIQEHKAKMENAMGNFLKEKMMMQF